MDITKSELSGVNSSDGMALASQRIQDELNKLADRLGVTRDGNVDKGGKVKGLESKKGGEVEAAEAKQFATDVKAITVAVNEVVDSLGGAASAIFDAFTGVLGLLTSLSGFLGDSAISSLFSSIAGSAMSAFSSIMSSVGEGLKNTFKSVHDGQYYTYGYNRRKSH